MEKDSGHQLELPLGVGHLLTDRAALRARRADNDEFPRELKL